MDIYNEDNIRYARFFSVCEKCLKTDNIDYMMAMEYQDKWDTNLESAIRCENIKKKISM